MEAEFERTRRSSQIRWAKAAKQPKSKETLECEWFARTHLPVSDPNCITLRQKMTRQYILSSDLICLEYFKKPYTCDENGLPVIMMGSINDLWARAPTIVEQWMRYPSPAF